MAGASMDLDTLLGPVADQPPCGPNLEYDPEFQALEVTARGKEEQLIGDKGNERRVPAVPPDWNEVREQAQHLFTRTKDLRVAILWTRAAITRSGLVGLRDGLALIRGLLVDYWEGVHPQIDPADPDPGFRMNVVAGLVDSATTLREVRHAVIAEVPRKGRLTVLDALVASGRLQPGGDEPVKALAEVQGLLREAAAEPANLKAASEASALVTDLQKLLAEKVGSDRMPDLAPLRNLLAPVVELCEAALAEAMPTAEGDASAAGSGGEAPAAAGGVPGVIRTREDAIRMLDRVCEYMERNEPASPAPLLIRRAQRLMSKNFVEIIEDLSPESLSVIKALGGIKE